jgi:hypothetical protein
MKIRSNRFLQLFVTLLFMLEFLAPALPLSIGTMTYDFNQSTQLKPFHHPGILLALFSQPFNENEEGQENDKTATPCADVHGNLRATHTQYFVNIGLTKMNSPSLCFNVHPSLFRLHHAYLI